MAPLVLSSVDFFPTFIARFVQQFEIIPGAVMMPELPNPPRYCSSETAVLFRRYRLWTLTLVRAGVAMLGVAFVMIVAGVFAVTAITLGFGGMLLLSLSFLPLLAALRRAERLEDLRLLRQIVDGDNTAHGGGIEFAVEDVPEASLEDLRSMARDRLGAIERAEARAGRRRFRFALIPVAIALGLIGSAAVLTAVAESTAGRAISIAESDRKKNRTS